MTENLRRVTFKTKHLTSGYVFSNRIVFLEQDYWSIPQRTGAVKTLSIGHDMHHCFLGANKLAAYGLDVAM